MKSLHGHLALSKYTGRLHLDQTTCTILSPVRLLQPSLLVIPSLVISGHGGSSILQVALVHQPHHLRQRHFEGLDGFCDHVLVLWQLPSSSLAVKVDPPHDEGRSPVHPFLVVFQHWLDAVVVEDGKVGSIKK